MHKSVYIKTFGCQMNERDSEIMSQLLSSYGYIEGVDIESADLVILNTCSIRAKAEQKVMSLLGIAEKNQGGKTGDENLRCRMCRPAGGRAACCKECPISTSWSARSISMI